MAIVYSRKALGDAKIAKAGGNQIRVSFKNTRETAAAIKGMNVKKAKHYLKQVLKHKDVIPFVRFKYGVGRTGQAKKYCESLGRWPEKSVKIMLQLIENAESNAKAQEMDAESLVISHVQVNQAQKMRRRTYRAHGRINKYESLPSHIQLILSAKGQTVPAGISLKAKNLNAKKLVAGASAQ